MTAVLVPMVTFLGRDRCCCFEVRAGCAGAYCSAKLSAACWSTLHISPSFFIFGAFACECGAELLKNQERHGCEFFASSKQMAGGWND